MINNNNNNNIVLAVGQNDFFFFQLTSIHNRHMYVYKKTLEFLRATTADIIYKDVPTFVTNNNTLYIVYVDVRKTVGWP